NDQPTRILQVIVELAKHCTDDNAGDDRWAAALPFLREALEGVDSSSQRSIDGATKAAEALGDSQLPEATQLLVDAIGKKMMPKDNAQRVRLTAIAALAKVTNPGARSTVVATLAGVIRADPSSQPPQIVDAAINTLGDLRQPEALPVLLEAMYRTPLFFQQIRRALVSSGGAVVGELRSI